MASHQTKPAITPEHSHKQAHLQNTPGLFEHNNCGSLHKPEAGPYGTHTPQTTSYASNNHASKDLPPIPPYQDPRAGHLSQTPIIHNSFGSPLHDPLPLKPVFKYEPRSSRHLQSNWRSRSTNTYLREYDPATEANKKDYIEKVVERDQVMQALKEELRKVIRTGDAGKKVEGKVREKSKVVKMLREELEKLAVSNGSGKMVVGEEDGEWVAVEAEAEEWVVVPEGSNHS